MSQSVMQENVFVCLLSFRSRSQQGLIWSKYDSFYYIFWSVDSLATKLGLIIHHHKPERPVEKKKDYWVQGQGHSEGSKFKCLSSWYVVNTKHFLFKLNIVMHRYESECHAKRLICYFQGQGHCKSSSDQNMTIFTVSFEVLILLLPNLVWLYTIIITKAITTKWAYTDSSTLTYTIIRHTTGRGVFAAQGDKPFFFSEEVSFENSFEGTERVAKQG